jgi:transcription elongation factor GreA
MSLGKETSFFEFSSNKNMKTIYLSQEGYDTLKEDLHQLKTVERLSIISQIAEARDKGDLSENAEYDAAKEAQGLLESRIAKLENEVANSRVLDKSAMDTSTVHLLTKAKIKNLDNDMEMTYAIVSESEADLAAKKISVTSPIGKGLLGKAIGETVQIHAPSGILYFEILDIQAF